MEGSKTKLVFMAAFAVSVITGCARVEPRVLPLSVGTYVSSGGLYHTVAPGETLYRISKSYHVDVSELMRVNNIYNPSQLASGQRLFIPGARSVPPALTPPFHPVSYEPVSLEKARQIVGPKSNAYRWETITVHHSATLKGSAKSFDRDHRRRHMGGLFYHFVIGNGSGTGQGAIETGWRWKKQVKANRPYDIQICLVGDFNRQTVSEGQLNSLVNLITVLQEEYHVPLNGIRKHEDIRGKPTECPGKNFPFDRLLARLSEKRNQSYFHYPGMRIGQRS